MISHSDFEKVCMNGDINAVNSSIGDLKSKNKYTIEYSNNGLYGACKGGHLNIVKLMIEHGAYGFNSGLCGACEGGHLNISELMIEQGANAFYRGLGCACRWGHLDLIKLMIKHGVYDFNWGLHEACFGRHLDVAKLMLKNGASDWFHVFNLIFDMIDSDIVNLMIERELSFGPYLKYPKDKEKMFKLCELGLPIDNLEDVNGSEDFMEEIEDRQNIVKSGLSDYLIKDLIEIVAGYVIN